MRVASYNELITTPVLGDRERFALADTLVRSEFGGLVIKGHIEGAFPFGSTQFNDHNPFSDYDILVTIPESDVAAETIRFQTIHDAAKVIHAHTAVPLEVTCYTSQQLEARLHNIPDSMLDWLKEQRIANPHNVIGDDFINSIPKKAVRESPPVLVNLDDYIARTRHILKKNWWQGCYFRPNDLLSIVLGAPHIVGRMTLDTLQYNGLLASDTLPNFKKETIARSVLSTFGEESPIGELYSAITDDAHRYQEEFVREARRLTAEEYDQVIEVVLEHNLPKAIELLRRMQEAYRGIYNDSKKYRFDAAASTFPYTEKGSNLSWEEIQHIQQSRMLSEIRAAQIESAG